eukprot:s49_g10.t2
MCKAMSHREMLRLLCRAAPVDWRNEQNYTLRRMIFGMSTVFTFFALIYSLASEHDVDFADMRAFTVVSEAAAVVALASNFLLLKILRHRGALLEMLTFIFVTLTMVSTTFSNVQDEFEFRLSTLSRSYSQFCYGVMLIGLHPAYYCAFAFCATVTHLIMVFHFVYHDQGVTELPDGLYRDLIGQMVVPLVSVATGFMINRMNLQLYLYQAQSQQESKALNKLLGLSCDFVLPLHAKGGSEICISQVKPELEAYVGPVAEGNSIRCIMAADSFEDFNQHVEQLAPMQPLLLPVTLKSGSSPIAAEMLLVRCPFVDDSEMFLVGVRIQEEIAPPDALSILPPGLDNMRPATRDLREGFLGILPEAEAYEDSELGRSDAAFTTKTGMIFNCSKPKEAWRNILQLGRKEHWLVPAENLSVEPSQILGSGGFGLVCEGKYCGANVAVKVPRKSFDTGDGQEAASAAAMLIDYLQELRLLRIARHPNIVIFYGAFMAPARGEVALVFERMEGPTLDLFILAGEVAENYKALMMLDITHALLYLHSLRPPIVHGDVKPGNVFVECREGQMITKLADFGLARRITVSAATMGGTLRWAAPELLTGNRGPSTTADIYSLGQLMYFILTSRRPYSGLSQAECQVAIQRGRDPSEAWPSGAFYFLLKPVVDHCRRYNPMERPRAAEVANVLENFTNSRPGKRLKSTEIFGKQRPIFGPSKIPGSTTLDESDEETELDADTELCQAFDRARMLVLNKLTT